MPYESQIVKELVGKVNDNARFKTAMQASFDLAFSTGISQFNEYNIHKLDDYYRFMATFSSGSRPRRSSVTSHECEFSAFWTPKRRAYQ